MEKLKPCPFCGGIAREVQDGNLWRIECTTCATTTDAKMSRMAAKSFWNHRTHELKTGEWEWDKDKYNQQHPYCSICGNQSVYDDKYCGNCGAKMVNGH